MSLFAVSLPGGWEWIIVLLIVMLIFGAGKLPQVFESFGKGLKSFRDAQKDEESDAPQASIPDTEKFSEAVEVEIKEKV